MEYLYIILVAVVVLLIAKFLLKLTPRRIVELAINTLIGILILWLINTFAGGLGINIPINIVTALVAGIFGAPGVIVLAIISYLGWI